MRIAAGGLQSLLAYDAVPQRSPTESQGRITQEMAQNMSMAGAATVDRKELNKKLERLNKSAKMYNMSDEFLIIEENGVLYVALIDKETGKIKRRISPERFLSNRDEYAAGVLIDDKG